ncbi:16S rRNA (cytidine(1402)-2'-O)-methyltransferase [Acidihalobacter ferrooxydans]|uniref:Ribosomal RNA small subunit methyltransferase I n=1 Tax=Acidihalobacter ferrooxydans TaxID=1765967 RepID=A0A1P8UL76_9GAMM|nr:16S rRNA (cytidine(1402)-2'-O)-methyltransferase [Acidihalobacter ferrooxydans]
MEAGVLYVVATPLGNLSDISSRAVEVLREVELIAAEDTRVSGRLLAHLGLSAGRMLSLHEHNEQARVPDLVLRLSRGATVALVSDAGTPLISDPGFRLVAAARAAGVRVSPVPGPSALIAALSVAGLPTDRFVFEGFLPARGAARRSRLNALAEETRTLVFYESSHRIAACVNDLAAVFGGARHGVIARELTKHFEQVADGCLDALGAWLAADTDHVRGEFVVLVAGAASVSTPDTAAADKVLSVLVDALPTRQAADLAARITGAPRQALYREAQRIKAKAQ